MHSEYALIFDIRIAYGAAGTTGFITGGLIATLKSSPTPGLFALGTGVNCFFLGSAYWGQLPATFDLVTALIVLIRIDSIQKLYAEARSHVVSQLTDCNSTRQNCY